MAVDVGAKRSLKKWKVEEEQKHGEIERVKRKEIVKMVKGIFLSLSFRLSACLSVRPIYFRLFWLFCDLEWSWRVTQRNKYLPGGILM